VTGFRQELAQALAVTPALIQAAHLLALPDLELHQQVREMLAANPALDDDRVECPACGTAVRGACGCSVVPAAGRPGGPVIDGDLAEESPGELADVVTAAAALLPAAERSLLDHVLADLDGRGFLDRPPERLAADLQVSVARVHRVIDVVRRVAPTGFCAVDLVDCLLLQVDALADPPAILRTVIRDHLPAIGRGWHASVARELGVPVSEVTAAREYLRAHLRPCVPVEGTQARPSRLRPDLVVSVVDRATGELRVTVTAQPRLRLHPDFVALAADRERLDRLSAAERQVLSRSLTDAAAFLDRLAQRGRTLHRVGVEVAGRQRAFLLADVAVPDPMTRADVAVTLGLHESTVSRAVQAKLVQVPSGRVVLLGDLFGRSRPAQECLRSLVAAERETLSDAELARALAARGHPVSRSAVRKYRLQLGIPAQHLR
jgi:RNA polymerase sigma-54 factor